MVLVVRRGKLIISIRREVGGRHHKAHCHVRWPDGRCTIALKDFELLAGKWPPASTWALLREYETELNRLWEELNGKANER